MFGNLFSKKDASVYAPVKGKTVPLTSVNDPTFAEGLLGKGIAIFPAEGYILAPADGEIAVMFETGHACSLVSKAGVEILIHVGLDTLNLKGEHFLVKKRDGDIVKKGDVLIEFDRDSLLHKNYDIITPIIIKNPDAFSVVEPLFSDISVNALDLLITVKE